MTRRREVISRQQRKYEAAKLRVATLLEEYSLETIVNNRNEYLHSIRDGRENRSLLIYDNMYKTYRKYKKIIDEYEVQLQQVTKCDNCQR